MKILIYSNSGNARSGYGRQTELFADRLVKAGHEIIVFGFYGWQGRPGYVGDILHLPGAYDEYGIDIVQAHADHVGADIVLSLIDPFVVRPGTITSPWLAWAPIDSYPMKHGNITSLRDAKWIMACSLFGKKTLEEEGFEDVLYCPLAIDADALVPGDRQAARDALQDSCPWDISDHFLVINISVNKGHRKNFYGTLKTFHDFVKGNEKSTLYLHTDPECPKGEDVGLMVKRMGLERHVIFPNRHIYASGFFGNEYLNMVYNAADVMLHLSTGEGFGLPIVEAQAAGCPVIVTDATAMRELCFSGWKVAATPVSFRGDGSARFVPLPASSLQALRNARKRMSDDVFRRRAREGALPYHIDSVIEKHMLPILKKIEDE